jgi:hypothetical protein
MPAQMFDHELNPVKNWGADPFVLDKTLALASSTVNTVPVYAGAVASIYPTAGADLGKIALGCPAPASGIAPMPMFLFQNGLDFDVVGDAGNIIGAPASGTTQAGKITGFVATGGFELETTEYVATSLQTGALLVAATSTDLGKVKFAGTATNTAMTIVGVVSDGIITSDISLTGPNRLRFWPCYIPKLV